MTQQSSQYPYQQPQQPPRRAFDPWTLAVIGAAALAGIACLVAVGVLCVFVVLVPPPAPATPRPAINPTVGLAPTGIVAAARPTIDPANIGKIINPYASANLAGMTILQIDVLDSASGNYVRAAQLTGADLSIFIESFNISVQTVAPDVSCPDHVRLSVTRADGSVVTMGACLKQVVILRGIPDLGGADAPMGPRFSDAVRPYLPEAYLQLLNF